MIVISDFFFLHCIFRHYVPYRSFLINLSILFFLLHFEFWTLFTSTLFVFVDFSFLHAVLLNKIIRDKYSIPKIRNALRSTLFCFVHRTSTRFRAGSHHFLSGLGHSRERLLTESGKSGSATDFIVNWSLISLILIHFSTLCCIHFSILHVDIIYPFLKFSNVLFIKPSASPLGFTPCR